MSTMRTDDLVREVNESGEGRVVVDRRVEVTLDSIQGDLHFALFSEYGDGVEFSTGGIVPGSVAVDALADLERAGYFVEAHSRTLAEAASWVGHWVGDDRCQSFHVDEVEFDGDRVWVTGRQGDGSYAATPFDRVIRVD